MNLGSYCDRIRSSRLSGDDEFTGESIVDILKHAQSRYDMSQAIGVQREKEALEKLQSQKQQQSQNYNFSYNNDSTMVKTALTVGAAAFGGIVLLMWLSRRKK